MHVDKTNTKTDCKMYRVFFFFGILKSSMLFEILNEKMGKFKIEFCILCLCNIISIAF